MSNYIDREALEKSIHTGMTIIEAMQAIIDAPTYTPAEITARQWVPVDKPPDNMRDVLVTAFWHENWQTLIGWYDGKWHVQVGNDHV